MDFAHLAEAICFIHLTHLANAVVSVTLIGHISDHLIFVFSLTQGACLPNIMCQWLLGTDVDATFHTGECRIKVRMIGGVNADAVDLFAQFVEHHAVVGKLRHINCPWGSRKLATIDVTECHNVFTFAAHRRPCLRCHRSRSSQG